MIPILLDITTIINDLVRIIQLIKAPLVLILFLISMGYTGYQVYLGGHDKRTIMGNLIGLMVFAGIVFSADKILVWIENLMK